MQSCLDCSSSKLCRSVTMTKHVCENDIRKWPTHIHQRWYFILFTTLFLDTDENKIHSLIWILLLFEFQLTKRMMMSSNGNIFRVTGHLCGEFTGPFDVFFDLRLNKRLSKHSWGWWFETLSRPLWRHCNGLEVGGNRCPQFFGCWYPIAKTPGHQPL